MNGVSALGIRARSCRSNRGKSAFLEAPYSHNCHNVAYD